MVDELRHDLDGRYSTELYSESVIELFDKVSMCKVSLESLGIPIGIIPCRRSSSLPKVYVQ